jgi:tetratricopeptide (TPR) repeat protein
MSTPTPALAAAIRHHQAGRLHEAELLYRQILAREPANADALHLLGVIAHQVGRHDRAVEHIEAALRLRPADAEMYSNLGAAYHALGRLAEAERCYQDALRVRPDFASARYNLGNLFLKQDRPAEAAACYRLALQSLPDNLGILNNLGTALKAQGDLAGAAACFERVVRAQPGNAEFLLNLGMVREGQGRPAEALALYRQAVRLRPDLAGGHYTLANALKAQGELAEAVAAYRQALQLAPDHADAHFGLAMTLLTQGEWAEGWREYEWRWRTPAFTVPEYARGRGWDGSELHGRTIVLYAEQGLGDTVQFARYAALVRQRGGRVLLRCQDRLAPLLAGLRGLDGVVPRGQELPAVDCAAALLSLPGLFGTTPADVPAAVPYLDADPARRARWRAWLDRHPGRKVGVCWQGNPEHPEDAKRSAPLAALAPLAGVGGVRLVSLQTTHGLEQLAEQGERLRVLDAALTADEQGEGFLELAALLRELHLVVSVDTVTAHLAGALGVATWLALPFLADWRWLRQREDTPWYPTMRLFRQPRPGEWDAVFSRMGESLSGKGEGPVAP